MLRHKTFVQGCRNSQTIGYFSTGVLGRTTDTTMWCIVVWWGGGGGGLAYYNGQSTFLFFFKNDLTIELALIIQPTTCIGKEDGGWFIFGVVIWQWRVATFDSISWGIVFVVIYNLFHSLVILTQFRYQPTNQRAIFQKSMFNMTL